MTTEHAIAEFIGVELMGDTADAVGLDDEVVLDGTIDSLGVTRLIAFLEREYDITIPPTDVTIEHFRSVRTMAGYVAERLGSEVGS